MMNVLPKILLAALACCGPATVWSFAPGAINTRSFASSSSSSSSCLLRRQATPQDNDRMKAMAAEEALNVENLKASAEQMKNMKPEDIDKILAEMDNMHPAELEKLKAMGMDPDIMKGTMEMMKENPEMLKATAEVMEKMTPEELLEQSRVAQENMKNMGTAGSAIADAAIVDDDDEDDEEEEEEDSEPIELDPEILDSMFRVAEIMSEPSNGGATFQAFATLPPVAKLTGSGNDDISKKELAECWNKGSLGATRVDRVGFERVWVEVQDFFYRDLVEEAKERTLVVKKKKRKTRGSGNAKPGGTPMVGANITPEQLSQQVKNMNDEDLTKMFDQMDDMSPEQEARMKAMGVDVEMMKKSASMMKSNPLLRKAATMMMKNSSPEQLMQASQEAQERMANMSEEEKKEMMDKMNQTN